MKASRRILSSLAADRLALFAAIVIGVYACVAVAAGLLVSPADGLARVGPGSTPGWGLQSSEKRLRDARYQLERLEGALARDAPGPALEDLRLGELRIASGDLAALRDVVERGFALHDELGAQRSEAEARARGARSFDAQALGPQPGEAALSEPLGNSAAQGALRAFETAPSTLRQLAELDAVVAEMYVEPEGFAALAHALHLAAGTDRQGRSIALRALVSIRIALQIGVVTALVSVLLGTLLGAAAGFFGGWVDHLVVWLYSTLSAIPNLVLLIVLAYAFHEGPLAGTLVPVYVAFCTTFWIGPCRAVRGETLKIKELEYVQAATAAGFSRLRVLLRHVLPNTLHLGLVYTSLLFVGAVKSEVVLSFLGLGVQNEPSWGIMIRDSTEEVVNGFFWQIGAATLLMFVLVLAFNVLSDALQDAFDPKHVS